MVTDFFASFDDAFGALISGFTVFVTFGAKSDPSPTVTRLRLST